MSEALWWASDPPNRPRNRRSRLRAVRGWPKTLSATRNRDSVLPSTRRGMVWKKDAMSRVLGLVLEPPGPPGAVLKIPQHDG